MEHAGYRQAQHVAHTDIKQRHQTYDRPQEPAAHAPDHLVLLLIRGQVSLVRLPGAVAGPDHCINDLLGCDLVFIIAGVQPSQH